MRDAAAFIPTWILTPGPTVKVTAVETKVSRRVLKRYVPVFQERAVDDDLLETGRRNLQEYFQSQGYYDVSVDFKVQPVHDDQETVEYAISRGMRYKLVRVSVTGNRYFDRDSIRERMFMQPAGFLILRHGRYSEAFRRRDEESISNLYKANGFRDVKVTSEVTRDVKGQAGNIAVTMHVDEGPQWVVDDLAIHGATQFKPAELPSLASSQRPAVLRSKYRERSGNGAHLLLHARLSQGDLQRGVAAADAWTRQRGLHHHGRRPRVCSRSPPRWCKPR